MPSATVVPPLEPVKVLLADGAPRDDRENADEPVSHQQWNAAECDDAVAPRPD